MIKSEYKVIGVMSGTSLDGIDLAYIHLKKTNTWDFTIIAAETVAYTQQWLPVLKDLIHKTKEQLTEIDHKYTAYISDVINVFINSHKISEIDAICSHGHTALHAPEKGFTYQIGNRQEIAALVHNLVVCDFRTQDVELGGQGAPLVPIGDQLLFSQYDCCLNLGGFANISTKINNKRIAYDICPANIVLNHYVNTMGFDFDDEGEIASKGKFNSQLFEQLNTLDYYSKSFPKSLGLEWVSSEIIPLIDSFNLSVDAVLRTFIEHIAFQVSRQITDNSNLLVTGGGAFNSFLLERMQHMSDVNIELPKKEVIEFKEATIFGLLGVLRLRDEINCLSSVTGASKDHSSGKIYNYNI